MDETAPKENNRMKQSKLSKRLEQATLNVNQMNLDIVSWGMDQNDQDGNYWQRNKTKLYTIGLFGGMTLLGYAFNIQILFRVCGILTLIYVATNILAQLGSLFRKFKGS